MLERELRGAIVVRPVVRTLAPLVLVLGACGASSPSPIPEAPSEHAENARPERCVLTGLADELVVTVDLVPDVLHVIGLPVEVHVGSGDTSPVHVVRPIAFDGRAARTTIRASLDRDLAAPVAGTVGAEVADVRETDDGLLGTLRLDGDPLVSDGHEWIGARTLFDCDVLRIGGVAPTPLEAPRHVGTPTHRLVGDEVPIAADAHGAPSAVLILSVPTDDARRAIRVLEETGDRVRIERTYAFGSIDGWVPRDRLVPTSEPWADEVSFDGLGLRGCGGTPVYRYVYEGMGLVRRGTAVHAAASPQPWGRLTADVVTEVAIRDDGVAEIVRLAGVESGMCASLLYDLALVPAEAVTPMPGVPVGR